MSAPTPSDLDIAMGHLGDVFLRMDAKGVVQYVSPSVRVYGYEPADLIGRAMGAVLHPDDVARARANIRSALADEPAPPPTERQNRYRTADGAWVWLEGNNRAIKDAAGVTVGIVNVLRDVTEQRAQCDLFEASFEYAAIGMAMVGLDGGFLRINAAFCEIAGRSPEEMRRLDFQTITHPEDLNADLHQLKQLSEGLISSYRMDKRYLRANGECVWVHLTVSMVRQPDGAPKYYVAQVQDLSQSRAAEAALKRSEARHRLIAENSSDIISMVDMAGLTTYISPSAVKIGYAPNGLVGRSFSEQAHPDDAQKVYRAFRRLLSGAPPERVRWRARHGNTGEWIWLESMPNILRDDITGEPTGFLDVIRDVSAQVSQEAALADARARAETAAAVKSQFLANMSHEIRTPLTAVLGFTRLLKETPELQGATAGYVKRIAGAGAALLAIVNDILDFSKLEAGKFEIRPQAISVVEICQDSLMLFSGQAEEKGVALVLDLDEDLPEAVMLDGDRVRQMLINLIGNALKFTERGQVTLCVQAKGDVCRIEVRDTGPGLDDEAQARLFQRFTQIDGSTTRRHGGTGLGLAICRGIVEAMGGDIGVTSAPGQGAIFHLTLPAPVVAVPARSERESSHGFAPGARVFVVDDNATNRELIRRILEVAEAEVSEAADGVSALEHLARQPFDVVLMDLRMPGLDGRQTLARLRERDGPNQDVPVLAFTADIEAGDDMSQFDGLVRKPISPTEVYVAIADSIAAAQGDRKIRHAAA